MNDWVEKETRHHFTLQRSMLVTLANHGELGHKVIILRMLVSCYLCRVKTSLF